MNIKSPSVAVVILSWNDSKNTIECLESVFKSDYLNYDVILVDNNSDYIHFNKVLDWCRKKGVNINAINFKYKISKKKDKNKLYIYRIKEIANIKFAKNLGVARGYNKGFDYILKKNMISL